MDQHKARPMTSAGIKPGLAKEKGTTLVQSLSRGLGILSQFTAERRSLSLAELTRRTGLHKATAFRFARTLEAEGFLTFDPDTNLYSVGPAWAAALYSLGSDNALSGILRDDMKTLAEDIQETVTIAVRRGDHVHIIHIADSNQLFRPQLPGSSLVPLHESWNVHAVVHLAYASEDTKRRMLAVNPPRYTERTITDRATLKARLARVADTGVAIECEEHRKGVCAVAVPVFKKSDMVLALGAVVPVERFSPEAVDRLVPRLKSAALGIGQRLDELSGGWHDRTGWAPDHQRFTGPLTSNVRGREHGT
jgi:IclR family transcriptional regulator, acetate operon repressor